jgi:hypothetical protein
MGTYINYQIDTLKIAPERINQLWIEHSGETEEWAGGLTFRVCQDGDAESWLYSPDFPEHLKKICRAPEDISRIFPLYYTLGVGQIQLWGGGYCHHRLEKLENFFLNYKKYFKKIDGLDSLKRFISYQTEEDIPGLCPACIERAKKECQNCSNQGGWGCINIKDMPADAPFFLFGKSKHGFFNSEELVPAVICSSKTHATNFPDNVLEPSRKMVAIWRSDLRGPCPDFNKP